MSNEGRITAVRFYLLCVKGQVASVVWPSALRSLRQNALLPGHDGVSHATNDGLSHAGDAEEAGVSPHDPPRARACR